MSLPALQAEPEFEAYPDDDEPQGWVLRVVELPDGRVEEQQLPLTMERLLHPEEGDKVTQTDLHVSLLVSVLGRLRRWLERSPGVGVFADLLFDWNRPGLKNSGPDIAVVRDLPASREEISEQIGGTFDTAAWGVRPHLAIEIVSPEHGRLRDKDLKDNVDLYAQAGITEYLVFNPVRLGSKEPLRQRRTKPALQLLGYHNRTPGTPYTRIQPDPQGRILSRTTGLSFWSDPDARRIEIFDRATGKRLLTGKEQEARADAEAAARQAEAAARKTAEALLEAAEKEIARLKALYGHQD